MSPGPVPDLAKRAEAARLYELHGTVAKVAEALGVTVSRAYTLCREGGVVFGPPGRRPKVEGP